jgi:hypothetical protein
LPFLLDDSVRVRLARTDYRPENKRNLILGEHAFETSIYPITPEDVMKIGNAKLIEIPAGPVTTTAKGGRTINGAKDMARLLLRCP